jgi:hypothetical protein
MNDSENSFQKLAEFIENHNAKRKRYIPFLAAIIIKILLHISRDSVLAEVGIGILTYRLVKHILN